VIDLVRAELLKARTTRGWYVYLGLIVLLVGLGVSGDVGTAEDFVRGTVEFQRGLVEGAGFALLLGLILAITIVTTEFRHGTITPTLLTTPRREIVVKSVGVIVPCRNSVVTIVIARISPSRSANPAPSTKPR